ncbi:hypothetical protein T06_16485 [Trichinella sp. T6]|nr:hypothetical protein T06_16485 [Trichinella sp. T6]
MRIRQNEEIEIRLSIITNAMNNSLYFFPSNIPLLLLNFEVNISNDWGKYHGWGNLVEINS